MSLIALLLTVAFAQQLKLLPARTPGPAPSRSPYEEVIEKIGEAEQAAKEGDASGIILQIENILRKQGWNEAKLGLKKGQLDQIRRTGWNNCVRSMPIAIEKQMATRDAATSIDAWEKCIEDSRKTSRDLQEEILHFRELNKKS